jgi:hypothetical protein
MKAFLATLAGALCWVATAGAIPQTIQSPVNIFVRSAGVNFEDFATDPASEDAATGLKGRWTTKGDTLTLSESATVFGIPAEKITATRKDGRIGTFTVTFRNTDKKTGKRQDIAGQLLANVRAYTGDSGQKNTGRVTFDYKGVLIVVDFAGAPDGAVVEFVHH